MKHLRKAIALTAFTLAGASGAMADVIVAGDIALGVNPDGSLNTTIGNVAVNAGATGIAYSGIDGSFRDATSPGCLCEGWGVSATTGGGAVSGGASVDNFSPGNLTVDSFTSDATSISSAVHLTGTPGISVTHDFALSADTDRLFEAVVTITNTTGSTISDLRYTRVMDWDIPLTEFAELVSIVGTGTTTLLERSHDNGFENVDPLALDSPLNPATADVDFVDDGPADHGAYFRFNFGDLADGESYTFRIFYGAAATEAAALAAVGAAGIELYSFGQPSDGAAHTFIFGFAGVGGTPVEPDPTGVPEPGSLALLGAGLLGLGVFRRKRKLV